MAYPKETPEDIMNIKVQDLLPSRQSRPSQQAACEARIHALQSLQNTLSTEEFNVIWQRLDEKNIDAATLEVTEEKLGQLRSELDAQKQQYEEYCGFRR